MTCLAIFFVFTIVRPSGQQQKGPAATMFNQKTIVILKIEWTILLMNLGIHLFDQGFEKVHDQKVKRPLIQLVDQEEAIHYLSGRNGFLLINTPEKYSISMILSTGWWKMTGCVRNMCLNPYDRIIFGSDG